MSGFWREFQGTFMASTWRKHLESMSIVTGLRRYKVKWSSKERECFSNRPSGYFYMPKRQLFKCWTVCLLLSKPTGTGQDCGLWAKNGWRPAASHLFWRKRKRQVITSPLSLFINYTHSFKLEQKMFFHTEWERYYVFFSFQSNTPPALFHQTPPHIVLGILQDVPMQSPPGHEAHRKPN